MASKGLDEVPERMSFPSPMMMSGGGNRASELALPAAGIVWVG